MSDDQKYEVVASVKISDLIRKQKATASLSEGAWFALLWGLYYWYFVYGAIENAHHSFLDTVKHPELAYQENAVKNFFFYAGGFLGIIPVVGFLACWEGSKSKHKGDFWPLVLKCNLPVLGKTLLQLLVIVPLLMALTCGAGYLLITKTPDSIKYIPWIGPTIVAGGIIIFVALAIFVSLLCALFAYFFNLNKKIAMIRPTAEGQ